MTTNKTTEWPSAATMEMQLQVDDTGGMPEAVAHEAPWTFDQDAFFEGTDPELVDLSEPSPTLQHSESQYNATTDFTSRRPLHCQLPSGTVVGRRYIIKETVGRGSFGCAYLCTDIVNGEEVVIKARVGNVEGAFSESIGSELQVYKQLGATEKQVGIPYIAEAGLHKIISSNPQAKPVYVSYLVLQRLGDSIWSYCRRYQKQTVQDPTTGREKVMELPCQPSRDNVVQAGVGMLQALAAMHAKGIIHRDVKTENFCLGAGPDRTNVYAVDMGFARPAFGYYPYQKYNQKCASFWGTPNYSSVKGLQQYPQTPRDDLEAMVFCMVEMEMPGCLLPWNSKLTTNSEAAAGWTHEQLDRMAVDKLKYVNKACRQGLVPEYLQDLFRYVHTLQHYDIPDYGYIHRLIWSGLTGKPPGKPIARHYKDWPEEACASVEHHRYITGSLLQQLKEAASVILPMAAAESSQAHEEPAAISSAGVGLQLQHQPASCQPAGQHLGVVSPGLLGPPSVQCHPDLGGNEDQEPDSEPATCCGAQGLEECAGGQTLEAASGEKVDGSVHTNISTVRTAQKRLLPVGLVGPPSGHHVQQCKRQRVDGVAVEACFSQVPQAMENGSQSGREE